MTARASFAALPRGVWILSGCSAILSSGLGMIVPLIPIYGDELGATHLELGLLVAGFFAGRLAAQIPAGVIADRLGRRPTLLGALLLYTVTCSGFAMSATAAWLVAFRVLQGIASGFFSVTARAAITDLCEADSGGAAQGVFSAASNLGFVVGPAVGALAAARFSFATPFWAAAGASLVSLVLLAFAPMTRSAAAKSATAVSSLVRALRGSGVAVIALANLFFWAGLSVVMTLFPIVGESTVEGGVTFVGLAFTSAGLFGLVLGPATGRLSDLAGRAPVMAMGAVLSAAEGASLLSTDDPVIIVACFGLGGIGAAAFSNGLFSAVGDMTSYSDRGTVNGIVGAAGVIGGMAGAMLAPRLWAASDLTTPFVAQVVFALVSAVISIWFWKHRAPRKGEKVTVGEPTITG